MELSESYKHLKPFEPFFRTMFDLTYNKDGNPRIIDIMENYLTKEDYALFKTNTLLLHKNYVELNHLMIQIVRLNYENFNLLYNK